MTYIIKEMPGDQARQGDVFIVRSSRSAEGLEEISNPKEDIILAHGEATGHAHRIREEGNVLYKDPKSNNIYLAVNNDSALTHEEHDGIKLRPGLYRVIKQRQYTPGRIVSVAD